MKIQLYPFKTIFAQRLKIILPLALAIVTVAVYWQVSEFKFVSFDDNLYVSENLQVQQGLNKGNLVWAFNLHNDKSYWHPLTWLSHMMDCQTFGLNPGMHHLTNLLIHIINVTFLFLALHLMTGEAWKSAFVAALFALHPINVDSVAWISERKNLLSTMFWILTMMAYVRYVRKPGIFRYLMVFVALVLGLLAKPMLVTLPCVLLLLDFWPLGRIDLGQKSITSHPDAGMIFQPSGIASLVLEKIPLLAISIATIALSVTSLQINNHLVGVATTPISLRVENAMVSYVAYLWKTIWPIRLAVFYPFPKSIPLWQPVCSALFLIATSVIAVFRARKSPYLLFGWLWFLGTLLPVIGLVQGGLWPALADRWAYVPLIGIFIIFAWGVPDIIPNHRFKQIALALMSVAFLCGLSIITWIQAGYWKNSQTLFEHALEVTSDNYIAHNNLGNEFRGQNRINESITQYFQAININSDFSLAHFNLGMVLASQGRTDESIHHYLKAIQIQPDYEQAYNNLATIYLSQGQKDKAIALYLQALQIKPDDATAQFNLGNALYQKGQMTDAIHSFLKAIDLQPDLTAAHINLANALYGQGKTDEAIVHYQKALKQRPDSVEAHANIANALRQNGQTDQAIAHYLKAIQLNPDIPETYNNLGVAYIFKNDINPAIQCFQKALTLKPGYSSAKKNLNKALLMQDQALMTGQKQ